MSTTTYEQHLATGVDRELARIAAQQDQDLDTAIDDLWNAEPYDPADPDERQDDGWDR